MSARARWDALAARIGAKVEADPEQGDALVTYADQLFTPLLTGAIDIKAAKVVMMVGAMRLRPSVETYWQTVPTAYHEAGHAVIGAHLGRRVASLTAAASSLTGMQASAGHVMFDRDPPVGREDIEREILIEFAGPVAENTLLRSRLEQPNAVSWELHRAEVDELALRIEGMDDERERAAFIHWMLQRAVHLIERHWARICLVAGRLMDAPDQKLTGEQFHRLLDEPLDVAQAV